jgi:DNA-binding transcriptional LysR family regulator
VKTLIHQWSNRVELLSYMRLFVEVARTKSFRRAADALDMPNSTLSRHITELEKTIGLRLLNRSTRKVELTEAGEVYFKRCQSIVEEARIAHESLLDVVERPTGTLRVSMPADLAAAHLAPVIADFAKTYPLIAFEFDTSPRPVDLQTEPFDLAIRIGPPPTAPLTLVARPIAVLQRYLYASPEYLRSAAPLAHPNDLDRHVVCIVEGATRLGEVARTFYRGNESVDVTIGTRFAMNSVALSRALALQSVGLAVLDDVLALDDVTSGRLVRVLTDWSLATLQVHAVTETRLLPARTRLFIDFLKARLRG